MKTYNVIIGGKNIEVIQNEDGTFNKPEIVKELLKFGTAMKPSHEPICMARKPLAEKTVAENCLKYGTGGINIDESRVEYTSEKDKKEGQSARPSKTSNANEYALNHGGLEGMDRSDRSDITGRFPANLIHDGSEEVRECFPDTKSGKMGPQHTRHTDGSPNGIYGKFDVNHELGETYGDSGNASRFFKSIIYQAKASKSERNAGLDVIEDKNKRPQGEAFGDGSAITEHSERKGNFHPTVKPIALMEYLIKMVTPKGGLVLDPFAGSGTTLISAKLEGYNFIGIELSEEYCKIAEARINKAKEEGKDA